MYGVPLGSLYSGVQSYLDDHSREPLAVVLEDPQSTETGLPPEPPGKLLWAVTDGNGVGYPLFVTAAFRLFGIHAWALRASNLLLMALSAGIFLWQFRRRPQVVMVTLYFSALTVMLFLAPTWRPSINFQVMAGGIRYFSLLAALPFFHILLTLLEPNSPERGVPTLDLVGLAIQSQVLLLVVLVRGTALPLAGGLLLVWAGVAWKWRRSGNLLRAMFGKLGVTVAPAIASLILIALSVSPGYFSEGRFGPTIWERVIAGMSANPKWPFPGVNEIFRCEQYFPRGIVSGYQDDNAHCIWVDYAIRNHLSEEMSNGINGARYEDAQRNAFFTLAVHYPIAVAETFVYYKPMTIGVALYKDFSFNFTSNRPATVPYSPVAIFLLVGSLVVTLLHFLFNVMSAADLKRMAAVTAYAALCTLPSYIVAFAEPYTVIDLLLYCLVGLGLVVGAAVTWARSKLSYWSRAKRLRSARRI
jgi:hypothetical protein